VLQALYNMVKCQSSRTRIRIGTAVCNLLSCPVTNKAAINAGALSVVKIIATMDFEELREATARVIINLAQDESLQDLMLRQPIVEILVLILQQSTNYTFECAIMAFSCLSQTKLFKSTLVSRGGITALIGTIITGKVCTPLVAEEVCRCLCHLSYNFDNAESMVRNGHLILSMQAIYLSGLCSADTALLITLTMRNLSEAVSARRHLIDQGAFKLLVSIISDFSFSRYCCTIMYSAMVTFVYNLSLVPNLHISLVNQGIMSLLGRICLYGTVAEKPPTVSERRRTKLPTMTEVDSDQLDTQSVESVAHEEVFSNALTKFKSTDSNDYTHTSGNSAADLKPEWVASPTNRVEMPPRPSLLYTKDHRKSIIQRAEDTSFEILLNFTHNEVNFISKTINLLSQSPACPQAIVDGGVMRIFKALIDGLSEGARAEVAAALANLATCKACREQLVQQGAGELLIALSITSDPNTQAHCALALGYLSELTKVNDGVVASLLLLSLNMEETQDQGSNGATAGEAGLINARRVAAGNIPAVQAAVSTIGDLQEPVAVEGGPPPTKNLSTLLRDIMVDKTRFDQYFQALKANNDRNLDHNEFVPARKTPATVDTNTVSSTDTRIERQQASKLNVNEMHREAILAEEKAMLRCDFQLYRLETSETSDTYESESGGMSVNALMELPLPGIPANRDLEPLNRHDELAKSKISNEPLAKDCRVPFHVASRTTQYEAKHEAQSGDDKKDDDDSVGFGEDSDDDMFNFRSSAKLSKSRRNSPSNSPGTGGVAGRVISKKVASKKLGSKSGSFEAGDGRSADVMAAMASAKEGSMKAGATPKSTKSKRM
jgi:hypothetical protein